LDCSLSQLSSNGEGGEAIIVAINSNENRDWEYSYARNGARYGKFLVETLKPFIDGHYRTRPGRDSTFLIVSSLGAVISVEILWHESDIFSKAAGLSLPVHYRDGNDSSFKTLKDIDFQPSSISIYLDHGTVGEDHSYASGAHHFTNWLRA